MHYIVLIFVARWRHNFREIAVKNCENPKKLAEKFAKFCTGKRTHVPVDPAKFDVNLCNESPLWGIKPASQHPAGKKKRKEKKN